MSQTSSNNQPPRRKRVLPSSLQNRLSAEQQAELLRAQELADQRRAEAAAAAGASPNPTPTTTENGPGSLNARSGTLRGPLETVLETVRRARENERQRRQELARQRAADDAAFLSAGGHCPHCHDRGACAACERGAAEALREGQERQRLATLRLLGDLPPRLLPLTFATFPVPRHPALAQARQFLTEQDTAMHQNLLLIGPVGTGKTGLLSALLHEVAARWAASPHNTHRIAFTSGPDLMAALRAGFDDDTYHEQLYRVMSIRLLAIDDLGAERPTEWVQEQLFTIINHRYEHQLATWITSNYGLDEMVTRIGVRVMDRLVESAELITVGGQSLRRQNGGAR